MDLKEFFWFSRSKAGIFGILFIIAVCIVFLIVTNLPLSSSYVYLMTQLLLPINLLLVLTQILKFYPQDNSIRFIIFASAIIVNIIYLWILSCIINKIIENKTSKKNKIKIASILITALLLSIALAVIEQNMLFPKSLKQNNYIDMGYDSEGYKSLLNKPELSEQQLEEKAKEYFYSLEDGNILGISFNSSQFVFVKSKKINTKEYVSFDSDCRYLIEGKCLLTKIEFNSLNESINIYYFELKEEIKRNDRLIWGRVILKDTGEPIAYFFSGLEQFIE